MTSVARHPLAALAVAIVMLALLNPPAVAQTPPAAAFVPEANVARIDRVRLVSLVRAGERLVAAGERGRVLTSEDDGKTWAVASTPTFNTLTSLTFVDAKTGFATGHQGTLLRTDDGGKNWQPASLQMGEKATLFAMRMQGERGMAVGAYGAFIETADGGRNWKERRIGPDGFDRHLTGIAAIGPETLLVAGEAGTLLRSKDGGAKWEVLKSPYEGSFFGIVATRGGGAIAYGMRGNAYRTDDGGNSWQRVDLGGYKGALQTGAELADGTVVLAGADGMIATSADQGRTFATRPLPDRRTIAALARTRDGQWLTAGLFGLRPAKAQ